MSENLENSAVATGLEMVSFHSNPKERQCQRVSNYCTIALISHTSQVKLKILQVRLQRYMNHELPDVQAGFRKGRGNRGQITNICWIIEKWESSRKKNKTKKQQKKNLSALLTMPKPLTCVDHNILQKILQEMGIPDHLICLLRNLYAGQEATELGMEQQTGSK